MESVDPKNKIIDLNMDFSKSVIIDTADMPWTASPMPGVQRRRLERQNAESGHTTSIVRYAPGSNFPPHTHGGGEEYLVLEGIFSDENGDFGQGYYIRNPPGSSHTPSSKEGCVIFVKLCQMMPANEPAITVDTNKQPWHSKGEERWLIMPLYENAKETVRLNKLQAETSFGKYVYPNGLEILLLSGDLNINGRACQLQTWGRFPPGAETALASTKGCIFWSKQNHL